MVSDDEEDNVEQIESDSDEPVQVQNFQTKLLEVKKCMDDFPTIISKLSAELEMLQNVPASSYNNNSNLETFIWRFHISFDWNEKHIALPIKQPEDIDTLNTALTDEHIYLDVVSFLGRRLFKIFLIDIFSSAV